MGIVHKLQLLENLIDDGFKFNPFFPDLLTGVSGKINNIHNKSIHFMDTLFHQLEVLLALFFILFLPQNAQQAQQRRYGRFKIVRARGKQSGPGRR